MLNWLDVINFHKMIAKNQRNSFNNQRQDRELLSESLLIVMDFKASVPLGIFKKMLFFKIHNSYALNKRQESS